MERRHRSDAGQSLIEFALVLPLLFLLIVNAVNFGAFLYAAIAVANAARAGADYMMMGPAYAGGPAFASPAAISNLVSDDLKSLPNRATATVDVCSNNNGAKQPPYLDCLATVTDPQFATAVVGQVTVTYTYTALIPLWDFARLNIHTTLPRTTIKRMATTRLVQ